MASFNLLNTFIKFRVIIVKKFLLEINKFAKFFGFKIIQDSPLIYLHKYDSYNEYASIQKNENKKEFNNIWADAKTLKLIAKILMDQMNLISKGDSNISGLCHGSRNGFEVNKLRNYLSSNNIFGTDISNTANNVDFLIEWDFHNEKKEWNNKFDFVYSNSLDQSYNPILALKTWLKQLKSSGLLFIEHTRDHSVVNENGQKSCSKIDPFGIEPEFMPYFLSENFGHKISIDIVKSKKSNNNKDLWLFIVKNNKFLE